MSFPEGFWWGAGASARHLAPDQVADLADRGLDHLRLTVDWAALEPRPGHRDTAAVEHAQQLLAAARDAGLAPWACLHDGGLPGWFHVDEHGWADARSRRYYWARHVEQVGEELGAQVDGWVPVFEPDRWASRQPGGAQRVAAALEGALLATVEAAMRLGTAGQPVASAHWTVPVFPARLAPDAPPTAEAEVAAQRADDALWGCWARLLDEETLGVPGRAPVAVPGARAAFDLMGLTYRHAIAVRGDGAWGPYPQQLPTAADGQVRWAEGLRLVLHRAAERFGDQPLLVAGLTVPPGGADERDQHRGELVDALDEAVDDGLALRGAWWTATDDAAPAPA